MVRPYIVGYVWSLILTVIPSVLVLNQMMSRNWLIVTILAFGAMQFVVQLFYFMHIRESERPAYNVIALAIGVVMLITVVGGSAWVMSF